jgi:hypothetical protein
VVIFAPEGKVKITGSDELMARFTVELFPVIVQEAAPKPL